MSKNLISALMLLTAFSGIESAHAECNDACRKGLEACKNVCGSHTGATKAVCRLACSQGHDACSPTSQKK